MEPASEKGDAGADAFVKDAAGQHALLHGLADAATVADRIDGREMVAMPVIRGGAADEIDAQRGAEQGLLDIMDGDGISAENGLDVALANEAGKMFAAAGVDDDGAGHDHDPALLLAAAAHLPRDALDHKIDAPLAGNARAHEGELVLAAGRGFLQLAPGAQAIAAGDNEVALAQVPKKRAARGGLLLGFDHDHAIHALASHREPGAAHAHLRRVDGRGVEVVGRHAIERGRGERGVDFLGGHALGPEREELADDAVEPGIRGGGDAHLRVGGAVLLLAEVEVQHLEGAPVLHGHIDRFFQEAGMEEMPLQRDHAHPHRSGGGGWDRRAVAHLQHQALRGAAGLHELIQRRLDDREAGAPEPLLELRAGAVHEEVAVHADDVAGKRGGVIAADGEALFRGHELLDLDDGIGIERARIIEQVAPVQRAETGIEVVKSFVREAQRNHAQIEQLRQHGVRAEVGAHAVPGPEQAALGVQERVAFALEGDIAGHIQHLEAVAFEKLAEMIGLALPLAVEEAGEDRLLAEHKPAVGGEDHVRQARGRLDELDLRELPEMRMKRLPLLDGVVARDAMDIARHPGVDHIFDPVMRRRTHEKPPPVATHAGR